MSGALGVRTVIGIGAWLLAHGPAAAQDLPDLINAYRAAPGACAGTHRAPVPKLAVLAPLSRLRLQPGLFLDIALERLGYPVERASLLQIYGVADARAAFDAAKASNCRALLDPAFSAMGLVRNGSEWSIILARPAPPPVDQRLPDWETAGKAVLVGINAARAEGRLCGDTAYAPAPPLSWNAQLASAALAHSQDMAAKRYFRHEAPDDSKPPDRAARAGYAFSGIGENIASGQESPEQAVAEWLASPGHCANLMNPAFSETGAAYAISPRHIVYWTQEFGVPR